MYHRAVMPERERLFQIARLSGIEAFSARFGPPQTAEPDAEALASFVDEHGAGIARGLIEEAAASDDVTDSESAQSYLDDRLRTLALAQETAARVRAAFREGTKAW